MLDEEINNLHVGHYTKFQFLSYHMRRLTRAFAARIHKGWTCADPESFFQRGPNFDRVFQSILVDEWIQIPQKSGHHRPANETPFKWRFAGVPMMAQH